MRTRLICGLLSACLCSAPAVAQQKDPAVNAYVSIQESLKNLHKARPLSNEEFTAAWSRLYTLLTPVKRSAFAARGEIYYEVRGLGLDQAECRIEIYYLPIKAGLSARGFPNRAQVELHSGHEAALDDGGRGSDIVDALMLDPLRVDLKLEDSFNRKYISIDVSPVRIRVVENDGESTNGKKAARVRTLNFFPSGRVKSYEERRLAEDVQIRRNYCLFDENAQIY